MPVALLPCRFAQPTHKKSQMSTNPCVQAPERLRRSGGLCDTTPLAGGAPCLAPCAGERTLVSEQGNEREQPQQCRCGPSDRHLRPLPLRLESKMPTHLLEGHLQLPAHHKPTEYLVRIGFEVGTQECVGFELFLRIAHQHPAHSHGEQTRGVPHGCVRSDLDHALLVPIPSGDHGWLPNSV